MYENICYYKNPIIENICRLDLASPIVEFRNSMPKEIYTVIKKYYPIAEPQDVIGTELSVNPTGGPMINQIPSKKWVFLSRDRKNRCIIEANAIVFSITNYSVFEELRESYLNVLMVIMNMFPNNQGKRLGLRYINSIPLKDHECWIDDKFISALSALKNEKTTKLVTTAEYANIDKDLNVRLLYGYDNPDYPAIIKKEDFIIDIDAYTMGIIYQDDLTQFIDDMHFEVQDCFEKMITNELRTAYNTRE